MSVTYRLLAYSPTIGRGIVESTVSKQSYIVDAVEPVELFICQSLNQEVYDVLTQSNYKYSYQVFNSINEIEDFLRMEWLKHFIANRRKAE